MAKKGKALGADGERLETGQDASGESTLAGPPPDPVEFRGYTP